MLVQTWESESHAADVYAFWRSGGLANTVARRVASLATSGVVVVTSPFLLSFIDWRALLACDDACKPLSAYVDTGAWADPSVWDVFVMGNVAFVGLYWVWLALTAWPSIQKARFISTSIATSISASHPDLDVTTSDWDAVAAALFPLHAPRLSTASRDLVTDVAADVAPRLLTPLSLPVVWLLRWVVLEDDSGLPAAVWWRGLVVGAASVLLLPFVVVMTATVVAVRHAEDVHLRASTFRLRDWSLDAKIMFWAALRQLPHVFDARLLDAQSAADAYLASFPPHPVASTLRAFAVFVTSLFVSVLAAVAMWDERVAAGVTVADRNLVFYLAVASVVMAALRWFTPSFSNTSVGALPRRDALQRLQAATNHVFAGKDDVLALYRPKPAQVVETLLGLLTLWHTFGVVVPRRADAIARLVRGSDIDI